MPRKRRKSIRTFEFLFNRRGIDEHSSTFDKRPDGADLIQNLHKTKTGDYTAYNKGAANFTSQLESGDRIDSIYVYKDDDGGEDLMVAINGKVKQLNIETGAEVSDVSTSNTTDNFVDFTTFKGNLFFVEKTMSPRKWTGTGSDAAAGGWTITNGSETYDKPELIENFVNRVAFANFNGSTKYPSHIAISDDLDPETFTISTTNDTDGFIAQVNPGDGDKLTALRRFYIPAQDTEFLICFKERSVWAVSGSTPSTFAIKVVNRTSGALNNRCVVEVGGDLFYIGNKNIYSLTTATESGNIQYKALGSQAVEDILADMNASQKEKCWAEFIPEHNEIWFGIPTGSSSDVDTILVYEVPDNPEDLGNWVVRSGMNTIAAHEYDGTFFTGTTDGYVQKWFAVSQYAGTGFNWIYRYPYFNFGTQKQIKQVRECELWFFVLADTTITVTSRWRGGGRKETTHSISKTLTNQSSSTYGTAIYGTSVYGGSSGKLLKFKIPVTGNGEQWQLEVTGTTTANPPTFLGASGLVEFGGFTRGYL